LPTMNKIAQMVTICFIPHILYVSAAPPVMTGTHIARLDRSVCIFKDTSSYCLRI
jgi:hypothetical protein